MDHLGLTKKDTPVHHHNFAALMERHHLHPCMRHCLFLARVLPFLMISSFFFGGLYVYLSAVIFHGYQLLGRVLVLVPFTPLFVVAYWAYLRTVFATHRPIPEEFSLPDSMREDFTSDSAINETLERLIKARNLPIYTRNIEGNRVRFCLQCQVLKPDRAHHCSVCNMCTRKMDHHCPMVSNCVAFDNYKFFVQFLGYTITLTLYAALTSLPQLFKFWSKEDFPTEHFMIFFLIVFCFVIAVSLSFLLSYHVYLVLRNQTTLEASRAPIFKDTKLNEHLFDLGTYRNFCAVFGDNKLLWFLPLMTSLGEGLYFDLKLKPAHYGKSPDWCVV